jgi:hypothetical protein
MHLRKDQALDDLATAGNVAQFVSFAPSLAAPQQTYSRIWRNPPNYRFGSSEEAIRALLASSPDGSINLRSFTPESPRSREFLYGLTDPDLALQHLHRLLEEGLHVIANETVDISDGGISGVIEGGVMEFAPDDTPRCVEKPGTASFQLEDGLSVIRTVYGFLPELPDLKQCRVEFSIHPRARGYKRGHTLLWEREYVSTGNQTATLAWPNRFSRLIGDKAFGLLIGHLLGAPVPRSTVISRRIRPFSFGEETGSFETWLRTCPTEQDPGRYTTTDHWIDPFLLLAEEDPSGHAIASIISQAAVPARFSGAAITKRGGQFHVEGTMGSGDDFMLGRVRPNNMPEAILRNLQEINQQLRERLGPVRFEWVHDGQRAWIVQLHQGATPTTSMTIVPGEAQEWATFQSSEGLEALRSLLATLPPQFGLKLQGEIGLTSHLADLARKSGRPTRLLKRADGSAEQFLLDIPH